nr:hybrid sensor histidine kinase/response regulator [Leptolyngbya sp. CCY15150]
MKGMAHVPDEAMHPVADPPLADILIVDDMPDNLRLLSVMLTDSGYKVRKAINGDRALRAIRAILPDLILLDINMPDMSGYDVCRQLKESDRTRDIPIIFISALDDVLDKVMAFEMGGVDYITKPFQLQEVLARIDTHLNLRRLQHQLEEQNRHLQQEVSDRMAAQQALEALNQKLEQRVDERTAALQDANEQLRTLEAQLRQQLNVFLHAVSHDLRNPVLGTSIVLNHLMAETEGDVQVARHVMERIAESNHRQLALINSLIDTHAAEVWGIVLHPEAIALPTVIQAAIADVQPLLDKFQTTLKLHIDETLPVLTADPMQLVRVIQNLVANAVKHNPPGLTLTITANRQIERSEQVHITVEDDGIGINPHQQEHLFNLYFRGNQQNHSAGLGLGLYLCQQIVEAHGGTIGVESTVGQGATFWFTVPIQAHT